ncbi:hypothetical protein FHR55_000567 [Xanthomonas arboricola]
MYLRRVLRWWAGKGTAAKAQMVRSPPDLSVASHDVLAAYPATVGVQGHCSQTTGQPRRAKT